MQVALFFLVDQIWKGMKLRESNSRSVFASFASRIFFLECFFFCSLLVEQEISLEKKKKTPTDQTAQIPRRKSRRRFGGLLEWPTTSSPMPKLVQFFGCRADEDTVSSLDVFFPHEKSKHQNPDISLCDGGWLRFWDPYIIIMVYDYMIPI